MNPQHVHRRRGVGVYKRHRYCWEARIKANGIVHWLGTYPSEADARAARTAAELKYWSPPKEET